MALSPTGAMHSVPLADLFFSTTDAKGIIDEANEVFSRNARYPREKLIGAPHNIIRHPQMPGGVFKLMWDMLEAGKPVCAYVLNLAGDGSAYWAFATIVPVGKRYLSVRSTPSNLDARDLLYGLYKSVRAEELQARKNGASAHDAAIVGAKLLGEALRENGFESYEAFMLDLVPVEVAARDAADPRLPELNQASEDLRSMTTDAHQARALLSALVDAVTSSLAQTDALARELRRGRHALTALAGAIANASNDADDERVQQVRVSHEQCVNHLEQVDAALRRVVETRKHLIVGGVIARLHAEAIIRYIGAVHAGVEDPRVSERALTSLATALCAILDADIDADSEATATFEPSVDQAMTCLESLAKHGGTLIGSASESEVSAASREVSLALETLTSIRQRIERGAAPIRGTGAALDRAALGAALKRIVEGAAHVDARPATTSR